MKFPQSTFASVYGRSPPKPLAPNVIDGVLLGSSYFWVYVVTIQLKLLVARTFTWCYLFAMSF